MKHSRNKNFLQKLSSIEKQLKEVINHKNIDGTSYIQRILCYNINKIRDNEGETLREVLDKIVPKNIKEDIMGSLAEKWFHEGEARGIQLGEARGWN